MFVLYWGNVAGKMVLDWIKLRYITALQGGQFAYLLITVVNEHKHPHGLSVQGHITEYRFLRKLGSGWAEGVISI